MPTSELKGFSSPDNDIIQLLDIAFRVYSGPHVMLHLSHTPMEKKTFVDDKVDEYLSTHSPEARQQHQAQMTEFLVGTRDILETDVIVTRENFMDKKCPQFQTLCAIEHMLNVYSLLPPPQ